MDARPARPWVVPAATGPAAGRVVHRRQDPRTRSALDKPYPDLSTRISPQIKPVSILLSSAPMASSLPADDLQELEARQDPRLLRALDIVAPGSALREGIDNIVHSSTGGLIVIGDPEEVSFLFSGGISLDIDYTPALLYQVAKMDGAIVLNEQATKIICANVQLMPDPTILSSETGTRHRTAERVSKQTDALVVAISERRDVVSLYLGGMKYILQDIPAVLAKANQGLATLDKYRARLDQVSTRLTRLEFEGGTVLYDVLSVLQRAELVTRMAVEVERYIVELGTEGRLIEMQLEETMVGVAASKAALIRDYSVEDTEENLATTLAQIARMPHQDLLDFGRLAELLGYDRKVSTLDFPVSPRGYRLLGRIPRLPKLVVQRIIQEFGGLDEVLAASDDDLEAVEGVGAGRAKDIREGLRRLQEVDPIDRYLQS
jgi:diadenylate cyclase